MLEVKITVLTLLTIANSAIALFVLAKRVNDKLNITFAIFSFNLSGWALTNAIFQLTAKESVAYIVALISYLNVVWGLMALLLLFHYLHDKEKRVIYPWIASLLISIIVLTPNLVLKDVNIQQGQRSLVTGWGLYLLAFYIIITIGDIFYRISLNFKHAYVAQKKLQLKYIIVGLLILMIGGLTFNLILPLLGIYDLVWLGPDFSVFTLLFIGYAIIVHRFLDLRIAIRRLFLRLILAAFAYGAFYSVLWFFDRSFGSAWAAPALITGIFIALIFAFLWPQIEKLALRFTNQFLYASIYNVQDTISNLSQQLTTIIDLDKIITLIADAMLKLMDVQCVAVIIKATDKERFQLKKVIGFPKKNFTSITDGKKTDLLNWLTKRQQALMPEMAILRKKFAQFMARLTLIFPLSRRHANYNGRLRLTALLFAEIEVVVLSLK